MCDYTRIFPGTPQMNRKSCSIFPSIFRDDFCTVGSPIYPATQMLPTNLFTLCQGSSLRILGLPLCLYIPAPGYGFLWYFGMYVTFRDPQSRRTLRPNPSLPRIPDSNILQWPFYDSTPHLKFMSHLVMSLHIHCEFLCVRSLGICHYINGKNIKYQPKPKWPSERFYLG